MVENAALTGFHKRIEGLYGSKSQFEPSFLSNLNTSRRSNEFELSLSSFRQYGIVSSVPLDTIFVMGLSSQHQSLQDQLLKKLLIFAFSPYFSSLIRSTLWDVTT
jgi:hypothetical protein